MKAHPPSGGDLMPLSDKYNDPEIKRLRLTDCCQSGLRKGPERVTGGTGLSCAHCNFTYPVTAGYLHPRGEFYCDNCAWDLSENGEFL